MTATIAPGGGKHSLELGGDAVDVYTWRPAVPLQLLLVTFHGMHSDADNYRDRARPLADKLGALVIAPKFAPPRFTVPLYQRGGVAPDGVFVPPGNRTVDLIAPLVRWAATACASPGLPHALLGPRAASS
jgi:hypothetical protein